MKSAWIGFTACGLAGFAIPLGSPYWGGPFLDFMVVGVWLCWFLISWATLAFAARGSPTASRPKVILVPLGVLLSLYLVWGGLHRMGWRWYVLRTLTKYEGQVVEFHRRQGTETSPDYDAFSLQHDPGPPPCTALRLPGGILDNWRAILFDESGELLRASQTGTIPHELEMLFGGQLISVEHLRGSWFLCSFT